MNEYINISKEKLIELINSGLDIDENYLNIDVVLQKILRSIDTILDCESTSYLEYNKNTKDFVFRYANGKYSHLVIGLKVPKGKSIAHRVLRSKKGIVINDAHLEKEHYSNIDNLLEYKTKNMLVFPVFDETGAVFGVIEACNKRNAQPFTEEDFQILFLFCQQIERSIRHTQTIAGLKKNINVTYTGFEKIAYPPFLYASKEMVQKFGLAKKISLSKSPVLITGERGSGKKLLAHYIHTWSVEKSKDYKLPIVVNCTDLARQYKTDLLKLEKILFGEKTKDVIIPGIFLKAKNNTVILSEVTDLPIVIQKQIYNCLQHKKIVLQDDTIECDVQTRVICTSSVDIEDCVSDGSFLESLYLYINTLNIYISPLANRPDDIVAIAKHYISYYIKKYHKNITYVNSDIYLTLCKYSWPHSVNELLLVLSKSILEAEKTSLETNDILIDSPSSTYTVMSKDTQNSIDFKDAINAFKKDYIYQMLIHNAWNCTKTAKILNIQRSYLSRLVKAYNLKDKKIKKKEKN